MKTFYAVLGNSLVASFTNMFVWFAVTFWLYLETKSVIATSVMAGVYLTVTAFSGFFLGSLVDRYNKKLVMTASSVLSLALYLVAGVLFLGTPAAVFRDPASPALWAFVVLNLLGAIAGNLRTIALMTLVTDLVDADRRDRANGLVGTANGVAFLLTSIVSGLVIGFLGMGWMLAIAVVTTALVVAHLLTIHLPARERTESQESGDTPESAFVDIRGTLRVISRVPGLRGLIVFSAFNNFLGGVFMSLMDAYGLELISVEMWGLLWGVLSVGFILGGLAIAKFGLGENPLRTLFLTNIGLWTICIFMTAQPWILLLAAGMFVYLCIMPVVEASEQTILQKVIVPERQGRVFGLAQSVEQAASPLTAFLVGPLAQLVFIPFMTDGAGADAIGSWYGTGTGRGIALLFTLAGVVGLVVTLAGMRTKAFKNLSGHYTGRPEPEEEAPARKPEPALAMADA